MDPRKSTNYERQAACVIVKVVRWFTGNEDTVRDRMVWKMYVLPTFPRQGDSIDIGGGRLLTIESFAWVQAGLDEGVAVLYLPSEHAPTTTAMDAAVSKMLAHGWAVDGSAIHPSRLC